MEQQGPSGEPRLGVNLSTIRPQIYPVKIELTAAGVLPSFWKF
jgi:hypothetical protein